MIKAKKTSNFITALSIAVATFGFMFCILAYYPGFMSVDSFDHFKQAKAGIYTDWHPPLMAWVWNKLLYINDGPFPMLVLFNFLYWLAVAILGIKIQRFWLTAIF